MMHQAGRHREAGQPTCARASLNACFCSGPASRRASWPAAFAPHQQAEHMAAPTSSASTVTNTLANRAPSTHGTKQTSIRCGGMSAFEGKADIPKLCPSQHGGRPVNLRTARASVSPGARKGSARWIDAVITTPTSAGQRAAPACRALLPHGRSRRCSAPVPCRSPSRRWS